MAAVPLGGGVVTTLASGLGNPAMVAVDSRAVYWADGTYGTIMSAPLPGSRASPSPSPRARAARSPSRSDGTYVYWGNAVGGQLMAVPVGGGVATTLATGQPNIRDIVTDPSCIYWTTGNSNTVMKIGKP